MLERIKIKNIALIKELTITLDDGLNILTGETGAGKSIIIDSLNFLLGDRADKTLIRAGENSARVDGFFSVDRNSKVVSQFFEKINIEPDDILIISRSMSITGKSETRVNGEFVTANMLRELTSSLVDIHGQHEHQFLLKPKNQLTILDAYSGSNIKILKQEYLNVFNNVKQINQQLSSLGGNAEERQRQVDLLEYQIEEIEEANLEEVEEIELKNRLEKMQNMEKISTACSLAYSLISGDNISAGALSEVSTSLNNLSNVSSYDEDLVGLEERLSSVKIELQDIESTLENYNSNLDYNQAEFEKADKRLDYIKDIKRKYGYTIEEVFDFLEKSRKELYNLQNSEEQRRQLQDKKEKGVELLSNLSQKISSLRKQSAIKLETRMKEELQSLGMKDAVFKVEFTNIQNQNSLEGKFNLTGIDSVEFMFSANLGQPLKSLTKTISGGEMSRFMLALKVITTKTDKIPTVVFDEIDTGISGQIADSVAYKMAKISRLHQVIVISHLPQITAMADTHFYIHKYNNAGTTITNVVKLSKDQEVRELARMVSGEIITNSSLVHCREMKKRCDDYKNSL